MEFILSEVEGLQSSPMKHWGRIFAAIPNVTSTTELRLRYLLIVHRKCLFNYQINKIIYICLKQLNKFLFLNLYSGLPYKETDIVKLYYTIGEVSEMFDVNTSLIRFWEKEFDIIKPKKNKKGNRLFTSDDIDNFKVIYNLVKEQGLTLDGAKKYLKENRRTVKHEFKTEKNQFSEIENKLKFIRNRLVELGKRF